jgi:hypothetical protein
MTKEDGMMKNGRLHDREDTLNPAAAPRIAPVEDPGLVLRAFYAIGKRMFGQVPTPETLMAHRPAMMLGIGGFYGAIEWFGTIDARLRALLQLNVARLYDAAY